MNTRFSLAAVLVALGLACGACGGKPEEAICKKLVELREKDGKTVSADDKKGCVADIQGELKECSNVGEIKDCIMALTDAQKDDDCFEKCKKK